MKNYTPEQLEATRPDITAREGIDFCLHRLYLDTTHTVDDEVVTGLTLEELIGALLVARDRLPQKRSSRFFRG